MESQESWLHQISWYSGKWIRQETGHKIKSIEKKKKKIKDKIKFKYNLNKWNPNNGFSARGQKYLITIPGLAVRKRQIYIFDKIFFIPIITIPKEYAKQQILNKDFISTKSDNSYVLILKSQARISSIYVIISSKFWSTKWFQRIIWMLSLWHYIKRASTYPE